MQFYYTTLYTYTIPYLSFTVHCICRCGRAGQRGVAHSLLTKQDAKLAPSLAALLRASNQPVKKKCQNKKMKTIPFSCNPPPHLPPTGKKKKLAPSLAPSSAPPTNRLTLNPKP